MRMTKRTLFSVAIATATVGLVAYSLVGYHHGRADFEAVVDGKPVRFAKEDASLLDGGSLLYGGMGYELCLMHRTLVDVESGQADAYLIGVTLTWSWPIRWFVRDTESLHKYARRQKTAG
jgi:hypothetical protein